MVPRRKSRLVQTGNFSFDREIENHNLKANIIIEHSSPLIVMAFLFHFFSREPPENMLTVFPENQWK